VTDVPDAPAPDERDTAADAVSDVDGVADGPKATQNPHHLVELLRQRRRHLRLLDTGVDSWGETLCVAADDLLHVLAFLQADPDADLEVLVDVVCIDHHEDSDEAKASDVDDDENRFEVVYLLRSVRLPYQLSVRVFTSSEHPQVPSVTSLYPSADWLERELYELFGVYADGHPHLRGLLLYPDFVSHPMRRDYPRGKAQPMVPLRTPQHLPVVVTDLPVDDTGDAAQDAS